MRAILTIIMALLLCIVTMPVSAQVGFTVVTEEGKSMVVTGKDISRPAQALILYTPDFGASTRTNGAGAEVAATAVPEKKGGDPGALYYRVKSIRSVWDCQLGQGRLLKKACGNSDIPKNGIVLSASGDDRKTLLSNFPEHTAFELKPQWFQTKAYPLTVIDPSPLNNPLASGFPGYRGSHQLVIYDKNYGQAQTGTNEFGFEVTVVNGVVVDQEGSNSQIPENGFVLSGHGRARDWLIANAPLGAKIDVSLAAPLLSVPQNSDSPPGAAILPTPAQSIVRSAIDPSTYQFQLRHRLSGAPCALNNDIGKACQQARTDLDRSQGIQSEGKPEEAVALLAASLKSLNEALWKQYPAFSHRAVKAIWHRPVELSRSAIGETLDSLKAADLNTVFLETYFHGYPIFPSRTYQSYDLPSQNPKFATLIPAFDPLKTWIEEAHKRGMKVHVWFQTFYAGNNQAYGIGPILEKHPDWGNVQYSALQNTSGKLLPSSLESGAYFLDPANPEVKKFLLTLIEEIVTRYDVDGLQLDYIRYPASFPPDRFSYLKTTWGYTPYERGVFKAQTGFDPADFTKGGITADQNALWQQWNLYKVQQVSGFVQAASALIRQKNHNVVVSAAIFPSLHDSVTLKHQDWVGWAQNGWLDMIEPMTLTSAIKVVQADTDRVVKAVNGRIPVVSGVFGPFNGNSAEILLQQIAAAHLAGAGGFSIFDSAHLTGRMAKALDVSQGGGKPGVQATLSIPLPK